jgi:DNA repair exonuclease SbcCD ATPase subunit
MRIDINKIKAKNFFSIGNDGIEFDYRSGLYRVTGDNKDSSGRNGAGKSVVLCETLAFALYGRPIRKINKEEMLNSTNHKQCEVEMEFTKDGDSYVIKRGIKPNYVIVEKNGEELGENANMKSTQKEIERIVGSDFQTFTHLLVMSNSYSTPFMDLDSNKKRGIIEDVLGIGVLGKMSELIKKDFVDLRNGLTLKEKDCQHLLSTYNDIKEQNEKLKKTSEEFEKDKQDKLDLLSEKREGVITKCDKLVEDIIDSSNLKDGVEKLRGKESDYKEEVSSNKLSIKFAKKEITKVTASLKELEDNPTCPICKTDTNSEHVMTHIEEMKETIRDHEETIQNCEKIIKTKNKKLQLVYDKIDEVTDKITNNDEYIEKKKELDGKLTQIDGKVEVIENQVNTASELIDEEKELDKFNEYAQVSESLVDMNKKYNDLSFMRKILSDDGIKNYIIKKVIKFWNMKVNTYLSDMNVNFGIYFDENLDSTLKSRNRDMFSYHNFSGGERSRIDVAILLAMLDLSRLQNNIDLNLMVIDELFDSAIDSAGREEILNLFKTKSIEENKSIYVISHSADLPIDLFDKEVTIYKKNGFTYM